MILVDLGAVGHKFAANFGPETVGKTDFFVKFEIFTNILLLTFFLKDPVYEWRNTLSSVSSSSLTALTLTLILTSLTYMSVGRHFISVSSSSKWPENDQK